VWFLLSAPQAFFGLAMNGWVLITICAVLTVTAWITVVQRVLFVYQTTSAKDSAEPCAGEVCAAPFRDRSGSV
jgi:CDP-diacylglycerol--glycerol-3-phosphate 3-phosphatidyltransferase